MDGVFLKLRAHHCGETMHDEVTSIIIIRNSLSLPPYPGIMVSRCGVTAAAATVVEKEGDRLSENPF